MARVSSAEREEDGRLQHDWERQGDYFYCPTCNRRSVTRDEERCPAKVNGGADG